MKNWGFAFALTAIATANICQYAKADLADEYNKNKQKQAEVAAKIKNIVSQFTHKIDDFYDYPLRIKGQNIYHLACIDYGYEAKWSKVGVIGKPFSLTAHEKVTPCFELKAVGDLPYYLDSNKPFPAEVQITKEPGKRSAGNGGCGRGGRNIYTEYVAYIKGKDQSVGKSEVCLIRDNDASSFISMSNIINYLDYIYSK